MTAHNIKRATCLVAFASKIDETRSELEKQLTFLIDAGRGEEAMQVAAKIEMIREILSFAPEGLYKAYLDKAFPPLR